MWILSFNNLKKLYSVAWEGDVYSQVFGAERSGYVRGLGLGPTPSLLWGSRSSIGSTFADNISNEVVQRLEQEVRMLKEIKEKHDEEMNLMKQNQDKLLLELSFIRKFMYKHFPMELSMPQKFNGSSFGQVFGTNIGQEKAPEMPHMPFGTHESQLPTKSTTTVKIESQSTKIPIVIVETEVNKNNMVQADDLTSLLKLTRKDNDEAVRILSAKAIANLSMNGSWPI